MSQFLSNGQGGQKSRVSLIIGGKDFEGSRIFPVKNPSGEVVWEATGASVEDAIKAVEAAEAALPAWAATKPAARRDIFLRAAEIFSQRYKEFVSYQVDETGADPSFIDWILPLTIDNLKEAAGKCSLVQETIPACSEDGRSALVLREPYGVILGIAPWNAPWPLGVRAFSLALAAGNTCVLKGPELAPKCFWGIVDAFRQAGLPDGVLNLVYHRPQDASEITTALIAHPAVKKVNFTGSTAVGSIISAIAGKYLKPIITELGGKASLIVLADADIEKAAAAAAMGAFLHAGQVCMSTERVIVHASVVDKFIDAFKASTAASYDGPNTRVPTLVNTTGALKTKSLVSKALKEGAEVLFGDTTELKEDSSAYSTAYMKPVILKGVKKGTDLYVHESFGPSVAIYTFETEAEAVEIANDTEYGLAGAVFTSDLAAGIRIAKVYETGAVHINHMTIYDSSNLPHGGTKSSGFGRFSAMAGLDEWLRYKVVTYDL